MPKSKGSIVRMLAIDECLRSRSQRYWSVEDFIDFLRERKDLAVSERTILGDIYLMRYCTQLNYNAPIKYVKKEKGYCYTDPEFSISKLPLTEADLSALTLAASTLNQYKQVAALCEFTSAIDKVVSLVNHIKSQERHSSFSFIEFEKAPYSKGYEHLNLLVEAIKSRRRVRLNYQKFSDQAQKPRHVSPYMLKEYRNRWYLLGYQHENGSMRIFGLDRICDLAIVEGQVHDDPHFCAELYFRNTIGISLHDDKVEEVVLSFSPHEGNYVKTQHLHSTQEVLVDDHKELKVRLNVVINYELVSTVLSFGEGVKVIAPDKLKKQVLKHLSACMGLYTADMS